VFEINKKIKVFRNGNEDSMSVLTNLKNKLLTHLKYYASTTVKTPKTVTFENDPTIIDTSSIRSIVKTFIFGYLVMISSHVLIFFFIELLWKFTHVDIY
jgi:hypothetical protein